MDSHEYAKSVKAALDLAKYLGKDEEVVIANALDEFTKMKINEWKTKLDVEKYLNSTKQ